MKKQDIPSDAKKFHGLKIGEVLYSCDDLSQPIEWIVFDVSDDGYARLVFSASRADEENRVYSHWADDTFFKSAAEAVRRQAEEDVAYYMPELDRAEKILKAIKKGQDFQHLLGPVEKIPGLKNTHHSPAATSQTEPNP